DPNTGSVNVTVLRNPGQGDLTGVAFIFSDGTNSVVVKKTGTLSELNNQIFSFTPSDLSKISFVKEVDIAPLLNDQLGAKADTQNISTKQLLQNLGAVSWWKLDGTTNDEMGKNNGVIEGSGTAINFLNGKFGLAANFTGDGKRVNAGNDTSLNGSKGFSYYVWARRDTNSTGSQWPMIIYNGDSHTYYGIRMSGWGANVYFEYGTSPYTGTYAGMSPSATLPASEWDNFVVTYNGSTLNFYKNSALVATSNGIILNPSFDKLRINDGNFKGQIDEAIFFNKPLTMTQISGLYNLDLTSS
ncbi:MAG TPA: LamG domain-containing protein, partial [Patescibacteria group bacterium]|nr:LamG domain-containing protein [Patescibacteria group bacterium]